jgi:autotransporter-associated beta strand protein
MQPKYRSFKLSSNSPFTLVVVVSLASVVSAFADATWTGANSSNMADAGNWIGGLPGPGNGSMIINNISSNIPILQGDLSLGWDLSIGTGANTTGRLDHRSGTLQTGPGNWVIMGFNNGTGPANATYNLADTSGTGGTYTGFAQGSGSLSNFSKINLGWDANTTSTMNVNTSGSITGGEIEIGSTGGGPNSSFNIDNGTVTLTGNFEVGGDQWSGQGGTSTFRMSGGSISAGGEIWMGGFGTTTSTISGGSVTSNSYFVIGRASGRNSSLTMTGGSVNAATNFGFTSIGSPRGATGTLSVGGTAQFTSNTGIILGEGWGGDPGTANGTLNITGSGLVVAGGTGLRMGDLSNAVGTVNLDGGSLRVSAIARGAGTANFNFNGGTLVAGASNANFMAGLDAATVSSSGAIIDTNGFNVTIAQALLDGGGGGGLTKQGAGALTLSGFNTYTGAATVNGGSLVLRGGGTVPTVIVNNGGIDSSGAITDLTVKDLATNTVRAGAGNAGFMVVENLVFEGDAAVNLRAAGSVSDQYIDVDTSLTTNPANGVILVNMTNALGGWTADPTGWDYTLINHGGNYTGNIETDFALGTLTPALGAGQTATLVNEDNAIILRIVGDPLTWTGSASANWNATDMNWTTIATGPSVFASGQAVQFLDGAVELDVNLAANVDPGIVTFGNFSDDYIVSSTGGFGITGAASLLLNAGGKVTLTTANSYTGITNIVSGILDVSGTGSIASSSSIQMGSSGELILNPISSATYSNPITGSGLGILKKGAATLTLSGASTFTGGFTLDAGQLNLNSAEALGAGPGVITINSGTLDNTSGSAIVMPANKPQEWNTDITFLGSSSLWMGNGPVTLTNTRTVDVVANTFGVGAVVDTGLGHSLVKTGPGTLVLNGGNIAGNLNVQNGIVGLSQPFFGETPVGTGVLQNAGTTESFWTYWNPSADVSTNLLIRNNGGGNNLQLGLIKLGPNTLTLTNPSNVVTANLNVDQGRLVLNAGSYGARNDNGTTNTALTSVIGWDGGANGVLEINGATVNYNNRSDPGNEAWRASLSVGNNGNSAGLVKITSGSLATNRALSLGNGGTYGAVTQTGGTTTVGGFLVLGGGVSQGVLNLSGGTFNHNGPLTNGGLDAGGIGVMNLSGTATYQYNNSLGFEFWVGEGGNGTLNLSGSATLTLAPAGGGVVLGQLASGDGMVNLLGGTLTTNSISKGSGAGRLNFDGGTLAANAANASFLQGLTSAHVRSGGGTIHNGGNAITIGQALLSPTGNGVSAAGLTVGGGGYIEAPVVTVNGDGSGATAVANIDAGGNLTGITITNPGNGYTTPPSFALLGGGIGNTGSIGGTATLVPAASGGMTFTGSAVTTLGGINTYTGNTTVASGTTLVVGNTGAITVSPAANGVTTKITGPGSASFDGALRINLSGAAIANGNSWIVVDTSTKVFNAVTFKVTAAGLGDFTPAGDGVTHTLVDGSNTWTFSETTGTLGLAVASGGDGFGSWITGFGLDLEDRDPDDDPDQDGVSNLVEYALGRNPAVADGAASTGGKNGANFELTFQRGDLAVTNGDVALFVEYGNNLTGWTQVAVPATSGMVGEVNFTITDGSPVDTVVAGIPTASAVKFFARVKVVK